MPQVLTDFDCTFSESGIRSSRGGFDHVRAEVYVSAAAVSIPLLAGCGGDMYDW